MPRASRSAYGPTPASHRLDHRGAARRIPLSGGVNAHLFDADGQDRILDLETEDLTSIGDRRLIWVDIDLDAGGTLDLVAGPLQLDARERRNVEGDSANPGLTHSVGRLHLTLEALEPQDLDDETGALVRREVDVMASPGLVVSVHRGRIGALDRFAEGLSEKTSLGLLDAGDLLSSLVDEVIAGYFRLAESVEGDIDRLDQAALRGGRDVDVLSGIVAIRRRIGLIRRTLAPHRGALAAIARPETSTEATVGQLWPGLGDRLEAALSTTESLRDALLGTYDIHMGRSAQHGNEVMKALTLLSAVLLPAVVLGGIMGMNFQLPLFEDPSNFYLVLGAMASFVVVLLGVARWRHWL